MTNEAAASCDDPPAVRETFFSLALQFVLDILCLVSMVVLNSAASGQPLTVVGAYGSAAFVGVLMSLCRIYVRQFVPIVRCSIVACLFILVALDLTLFALQGMSLAFTVPVWCCAAIGVAFAIRWAVRASGNSA